MSSIAALAPSTKTDLPDFKAECKNATVSFTNGRIFSANIWYLEYLFKFFLNFLISRENVYETLNCVRRRFECKTGKKFNFLHNTN